MRLDQRLKVQENMSRARAQLEIKSGHVLVNDQIVKKTSYKTSDSDKILLAHKIKFVSRAGEKVDAALSSFNISTKNKIALDIGSSTGGFVDCLIQRGAKHVYAVDVGTNQLDTSLRKNKNINVCENTDIRNYQQPADVEFDIITIDISFISIEKIIPKLKELATKKTDIIALIKPQFETEKKYKTKAGVLNSAQSTKILQKVLENLATEFNVVNVITSPIVGKKGNAEFLAHIKIKG